MTELKAIPVKYKGNSFRSKLEARWAVFFNTLGIPYEYEKETYDLDGVLYCPDFWLPQQKCWIEIKGKKPTEPEENKLRILCKKTNKDGYIFWGEMPYPCPDGSWGNEDDSAYKISSDGSWDNAYWWCICKTCGKIDIEFNGRAGRIDCKCNEGTGDAKLYNYDDLALVHAYSMAKEYDFFAFK